MKTIILLLWLFCAKSSFGQDWIQIERYETEVEDVFSVDETVLKRPLRSVPSDTEDDHSADSEEPQVSLDDDGSPRDKRTLGAIVQGLASALGYTLTPLQVASLPNPSPPPRASPAPPAPKIPAAPPKAPAPAPPPAKTPTPPPQPRQRETIRLTGIVNFGPNANANLPAQLGQYEQLFHGSNVSAAPAAPAPAPPAPAPIPKPTLAKIPSPIVPNLSPLLPPSRPPVSMPGKPPAKPAAGRPTKQEVETEYRKQENSEQYDVKNEEVHGDSNPFLGYVREPNWQQEYIARLRELEERQREYADKLNKHEALLVQRQQDHENTDERFVNREKEIIERDKIHHDRLRDEERPNVSQKDEERLRTSAEDSSEDYEEGDKSSEGYRRPSDSEKEEERPDRYEDEEKGDPKQYSDYNEEPKKYLDYQGDSQDYGSYDSGDDTKLPIAKDEETQKPEDLRNSYGESLEDRGKIDENIANYFVKFKDPKTGLYVPEKTQVAKNYNKEKEPWWKGWQEEFDGSLEHLRQEYSSPAPESKYEEYELEEEPEDGGRPAEKLQRGEEADERTSEANNAQKIPDYSEAFGGFEPYLEQLKPEPEQDVIPPSVDTAESPRSESRQKSDSQAEKSGRSEDETDIPFYHFDFKSFMPYHSPIKYFYNSDDAASDAPLIQSHNQDSKIIQNVEPTKAESPVESEESSEEHQPIMGLPERPSIKNLHEGESKELRAWPAPFDYVFDSTEQTNIAELPRNQQQRENVPTESDGSYPSEGLQATPVGHLVPEYGAFNQRPRGIQQQERDPESYHGQLVSAQNLQEDPNNFGFQEYARFSSALDGSTQHPQVPSVPAAEYYSQEDSRQVNYDARYPHNKINEPRTLQPPELQSRQYTFSDIPSVNYQSNYETKPGSDDRRSQRLQETFSRAEENHHKPLQQHQQQPVELQYHREIPHENDPISQGGPGRHFGPGNADLRNRGQDFGQYYTSVDPRLNGRRFDESQSHQPQNQGQLPITSQEEDKSSLKFEDPKSAHDFFGFSQNDYDFDNNRPNEKSHTVPADNDESLDLLVVSDPTPYQYDVKLTEYTDEPESDTEKVKVKEYRNKIATVTVSEKKQLSPEGPVHHIGYSHRF